MLGYVSAFLHCVVRIRETSVPPVGDPFIFNSIFGPFGVSCLLLFLLLLLIHSFSVLSLQLKKLRQHNKSATDLSNANPACGHKEVRRSTGHIMVPTRYSDQQGSKSQQIVICDSTSNGTDQHQNGSSNLLTPYQEQPRSTRIVVAYPRPAFSATKRTNYASTSFDQRVQVSQGHTSFKNKEN